MPATTGFTVAAVTARINLKFRGDAEFDKKAYPAAFFYRLVEESYEDICTDLLGLPEEDSINTVVSTEKYAFDGDTVHFPITIGEITRVDYDGETLEYRYQYNDEVTPKATGDADGTPDGWAVTMIAGVRYLVLVADGTAVGADSIVALRVFHHRLAKVITSDSDVINLWKDAQKLVEAMCISKVYLDLDKYDKMFVWKNEAEGYRRSLKSAVDGWLGRNVVQIQVYGSQDIYE